MTEPVAKRFQRPALLFVMRSPAPSYILCVTNLASVYVTFKRNSAERSGNMKNLSPPPYLLPIRSLSLLYISLYTTSLLTQPPANTLSSITTTQKMLKASSILHIPVYATTQNRAGLGETCAELDLSNAVEHVDKTAFSMWTPSISQHFSSAEPSEVIIVGIESHICVTQTALDLLAHGHKVYILADGISSRNAEEVPIALARLRSAGAVITTSESMIYEIVGDAKREEFKAIVGLVKEYIADTKDVMSTLLGKSKI
ncbi:hypothetical protein CJF32_00011008 [Rutstroemia sp. NJR-2017a WRK4]|nr:hypothetical protein CJF32_00011008 [Rutstroemia sp. NJR-2017a WRK4]